MPHQNGSYASVKPLTAAEKRERKEKKREKAGEESSGYGRGCLSERFDEPSSDGRDYETPPSFAGDLF